ncbi:MAG TPA: BrnT family toxin [Candidatus Binatia bacterium]|nr:BrnT family toxin [Candidatus Binatia bacterium]
MIQRRLLAVMFTERGQAIRLVSARKATRRERREYEEK